MKKQREDQKTKRQNFIASPVFLGVVFVSLALVAVAVFGIVNYFRATRTYTDIEGLSSSIPKYVEKSAEKQLYQKLTADAAGYDGNFSMLTARLRTGTESEKADGDTVSGSFIVDIDAVERNYKISYSYDQKTGEDSAKVEIICVDASESIYSSSCAAAGQSADLKESYAKIDAVLPKVLTIPDGSEVYVNRSLYYVGTSDQYFEVTVNSCGDAAKNAAGLAAFKNYIEAFGVDPDPPSYEVRSECYQQF